MISTQVVELRDEAAAADAATLAALTYLDATDGSDALLKKLEAQRVGPQKHTGMSYGLDAICQYPPDSDSDNDSMADVELSMANTHLDYKVHRHRCQIPMDYLDLQRTSQRGTRPPVRGVPTKLRTSFISVTSKSIRPMFGRIDGSPRVLEARRKA